MSTSLMAGVCQVEVTYFYKTGHSDKAVYEVESQSKDGCEKIRAAYEINTIPKKLKSKKATVKWLG